MVGRTRDPRGGLKRRGIDSLLRRGLFASHDVRRKEFGLSAWQGTFGFLDRLCRRSDAEFFCEPRLSSRSLSSSRLCFRVNLSSAESADHTHLLSLALPPPPQTYSLRVLDVHASRRLMLTALESASPLRAGLRPAEDAQTRWLLARDIKALTPDHACLQCCTTPLTGSLSLGRLQAREGPSIRNNLDSLNGPSFACSLPAPAISLS